MQESPQINVIHVACQIGRGKGAKWELGAIRLATLGSFARAVGFVADGVRPDFDQELVADAPVAFLQRAKRVEERLI